MPVSIIKRKCCSEAGHRDTNLYSSTDYTSPGVLGERKRAGREEKKKETTQCLLRGMCRHMNYSSIIACAISRYVKSSDQV